MDQSDTGDGDSFKYWFAEISSKFTTYLLCLVKCDLINRDNQ